MKESCVFGPLYTPVSRLESLGILYKILPNLEICGSPSMFVEFIAGFLLIGDAVSSKNSLLTMKTDMKLTLPICYELKLAGRSFLY